MAVLALWLQMYSKAQPCHVNDDYQLTTVIYTRLILKKIYKH